MTLARRIIPCLDVDAGRVVKGIEFEGLRDMGDPAELAARYNLEGADELVVLDISATHEGRATFLDTIRRVAEQLNIPLTAGGGIRKLEDGRAVLRAGADKVTVNTAAVKRPELISELSQQFGAQAVVLSIDVKRTGTESWEAYTRGGRDATGLDAAKWAAEAVSRGAGEILLTSIDRDGTCSGFDCELTAKIAADRARAGDRLRRREHLRRFSRCVPEGRRRRGPGRVGLPQRHAFDSRAEEISGRSPRADPPEQMNAGQLKVDQ